MRWSLESGKAQAETLNYVPLPQTLVQQIEMYWQRSFGPATMTASAGGKR
jgi:phosphate transport system substrate-binding protein